MEQIESEYEKSGTKKETENQIKHSHLSTRIIRVIRAVFPLIFQPVFFCEYHAL